MNDFLNEIELNTYTSNFSTTINDLSVLDEINPDFFDELENKNQSIHHIFIFNNKYTLQNLIGVYNVNELINSNFSLDVLFDFIKNPSDYAYYLNENKNKSSIIFDFIKILNNGYTISDLSLNPIIDSYYNFLFQTLYKIYSQPGLFNSYSSQIFNDFNELLSIWNDNASIVRTTNMNSFLIYNYYYDLSLNLNNIKKMNFTKNEIIMLNYYKFYRQEQHLIRLNDFYNSEFKVNKLLRKNDYIVDNNKNELTDLFINKDYILYNNTSPFLYDYEINYTTLTYSYNHLYQIFSDYLPVIDNMIVITGQLFTFYDSTSNNVLNYNKIILSKNGWLSLFNNTLLLCSIRFFPYDLLHDETNRSVQYNYDYVNKQFIEIKMEITTITDTYHIIIHLYKNGLITFYVPNQINTQNLLYSLPDPSMNTTQLYYSFPMYYSINNNTVNSNFYTILKFNFTYLYDGFIGFTATQLLNTGYILQDLIDASCNAFELRNYGVSSSILKNNGYSIDSIISAYHLSMIELLNLGYTLRDIKYYFKKNDYENNNIDIQQLYNVSYSINDFILMEYTLTDISALNFNLIDYLNSNIFTTNFDYLNNNIFTSDKLNELYLLFIQDYNYYQEQIIKIFNFFTIEKIYDSGFSLEFIRQVIYDNINEDTIVNLNIDFLSLYELVLENKITFYDLYDASYNIYDIDYRKLNNAQIINLPYSILISGFSVTEIEEYYFNSILIHLNYNSTNNIYKGLNIIQFNHRPLSIIYNNIFSDVYKYHIHTNTRNYTTDEKILLLYNLYNYDELKNDYGIDFILKNNFDLTKIYYLYNINKNIPEIPLTDIVKYNYKNSYNVFYLYYIFYGYYFNNPNNANIPYIDSLFKSSNISDKIILYYFFSFYYESLKHNFSFYDVITKSIIHYSIDINQIIDFGHEVNNLIYYDISLNTYKNSTVQYNVKKLYENGFSLPIILSFYTTNHLYNNDFDLNILNEYYNNNLNILINAGYGVTDFKKYGYSIQLLYPTYYNLLDLKNGGYTIRDFLSIDNISINDLKHIGFELNDFGSYFTIPELKREGYTIKELNSSGTVLEDYCKKEKCKMILLQQNNKPVQNEISSKIVYSQNIQNRKTTYSTNYSNYKNNIDQVNLFCTNNQLSSSIPSNVCNVATKYNTTNTYFIRNYITTNILNQDESQLKQHIQNIISIQNKYQYVPFDQITSSYVYLIINLAFNYPDYVIEYMITQKFIENLKLKYNVLVDSNVIKYINDIKNIYNNNPAFTLSSIIDNYISNVGII